MQVLLGGWNPEGTEFRSLLEILDALKRGKREPQGQFQREPLRWESWGFAEPLGLGEG